MGFKLAAFAMIACTLAGCSSNDPVEGPPPLTATATVSPGVTGDALAGIRYADGVLIAFASKDNGSAIHGILVGTPPNDREWIAISVVGPNVSKLGTRDGLIADMADAKSGITISQNYTDACNPLKNDRSPCLWSETLTAGAPGVTGSVELRTATGQAFESIDVHYEGTTDRYGPRELRFTHGTISTFGAVIVEDMQ